MCQSVSLLVAASNHDGHHQEQTKTTEVNAGDDLDVVVPPHPALEPQSLTAPLPSPPSPAFIYYEDDFRYCYEDDSHLQDEEDDDDGGDQLLHDDDGDGANQALEENAPAVEERAPTTVWLAAKVAGFARQKLAGVNAPGAVVMGLGLAGGAIVGAYFLWPAAAGVAAVTGATMKAPGASGFLISRAAFLANPQLYFQILRTAGAAAAATAFAL